MRKIGYEESLAIGMQSFYSAVLKCGASGSCMAPTRMSLPLDRRVHTSQVMQAKGTSEELPNPQQARVVWTEGEDPGCGR
jgi:hypothetical protein